MIFKDNSQWLVCSLSAERVLSTQRLREVFAVDWDLGTNGIFVIVNDIKIISKVTLDGLL